MFFSATDEHGFSRMKRGGVKGGVLAHANPRSREGRCWVVLGMSTSTSMSTSMSTSTSTKMGECLVLGDVVFEGSLPPHPRPLSPVGGEGGQFLVFS